MTIDISQYRTLYLTTAYDLLKTMKAHWEILNKDTADSKALDELHRAAHSLKSQSLVMGYPQLGLLNKELELLFRECKEGKIKITQTLLDTVKRTITSSEYSLDRISQNQTEPDINPQIREIEELVGATA
jgi:chemotaxis protein histidine kinase CheA